MCYDSSGIGGENNCWLSFYFLSSQDVQACSATRLQSLEVCVRTTVCVCVCVCGHAGALLKSAALWDFACVPCGLWSSSICLRLHGLALGCSVTPAHCSDSHTSNYWLLTPRPLAARP